MALIDSEENETMQRRSRSSIEKHSSNVSHGDEKGLDVETTSFSSEQGDEALKLVGSQRTHVFSEEYNARLRRKLDWVIPTICASVYFSQFLDKTALNYASVTGLPITGENYNLISMAFYLGFLVWEFPSMYIAQKFPLAKYLGCNVVIWGIILMCQGATTNFSVFFLLRFMLGMCECCVAPILILIISMFYKKDEQARRISWFYVMNGLTQVFGGFVAYGISFEKGSLAPFRIIFILLGALAILVGVCVLIWLPDSPVSARMLTQEERIAALERVRNDQGGTENKHFKKEQVNTAKIRAGAQLMRWSFVHCMLTSIPNGALSNYSNIIIKSFGYTSKQTLILSTPGGLVAAATTLACGWYSDKKGERMLPIVFCLIPTIVGSAMLIGLNNAGKKGVLLFAVYLIGTFGSALSSVYAYNASNTGGHTKKVTINAMTLATFSVGNIIGTEIFQPKDAPAYIPGKTAIMVLLIIQLFVSYLLRWINVRLNKKRKANLQNVKEQKGWTDADVEKERERHAFMDLTDRQNLFFVYTV